MSLFCEGFSDSNIRFKVHFSSCGPVFSGVPIVKCSLLIHFWGSQTVTFVQEFEKILWKEIQKDKKYYPKGFERLGLAVPSEPFFLGKSQKIYIHGKLDTDVEIEAVIDLESQEFTISGKIAWFYQDFYDSLSAPYHQDVSLELRTNFDCSKIFLSGFTQWEPRYYPQQIKGEIIENFEWKDLYSEVLRFQWLFDREYIAIDTIDNILINKNEKWYAQVSDRNEIYRKDFKKLQLKWCKLSEKNGLRELTEHGYFSINIDQINNLIRITRMVQYKKNINSSYVGYKDLTISLDQDSELISSKIMEFIKENSQKMRDNGKMKNNIELID